MGYRHGHIQAAQVGDDAHAEALDAALMGDNHLGHRAHAYGIGSPTGKHAVLGRRLVGRPLSGEIDTVLYLDAMLGGDGIGLGNECLGRTLYPAELIEQIVRSQAGCAVRKQVVSGL